MVGVQLLLLWSLSPIGGQASLRALVRTDKATHNATQLRYLYTGPFTVFLRPNRTRLNSRTDTYSTMFATSHAMKIAPRDKWGNVRVPRLELLPGARNDSDARWHAVPPVSQVEQLTSLVGVPVIGLPHEQENVAVDFNLETSYMSLQCAPWETLRDSDPSLRKYRKLWKSRDPLRFKPGADPGPVGVEVNVTFFLDGDMPVASRANVSALARDPRPRRLFFGSVRRRDDASGELSLSATQCTVTETHAEVAVRCPTGRRDCTATHMRRSRVDTRPEFGSPLDYAVLLRFITQTLPFVSLNGGTASTPAELFLRHGTRYVRQEAGKYVDLSEVPPPLFARRLMLVLNTWYQVILTGGPVFMGDAPANVSAYGYDFGQLPANGSVPQSVVDRSCWYMCTRGTEARLTHSVQVYAYHPAWLVLLFACSGALLLTGLAGVVLSWRTSVPDMLGYVASMTYNNVYMPLPERGGALDAMHRARILRDLPVSIGDVCGDDKEVGRVAFTYLTDIRRLEKGRKYI